jgi:hypothetical protein
VAAGLLLVACARGGGAEGRPPVARPGPKRAGAASRPATLVLRGGVVLTMDAARPRASALAIAGDRLVAVGSDAEVAPFIGADTRVVELAGRAVTPGLVDAHAHLVGLGATLRRVDLRDSRSEAEASERVARAARQLPPHAWVVGRGWDHTTWPAQRFPGRGSLDAAVGARPALLYRVDGHAAWVNGAALARAGISAATADPPGGRILRDARGQPTGVLIDAAVALVERRLPEPTTAEIEQRILSAAAVAVSHGLTGVHEMGIDERTAGVYRQLAAAGRLPLRVYAFLEGDAQIAVTLAHRQPQIAPGGTGWFELRGVKMYADGALGSRGARLLAPYSDEDDHRGLWVQPPEVIERTALAAAASGWQLAVHAIGDAANRAVLDAFETAMVRHPGDHRFRIEHAQVIARDDFPRFARLGVIASVQPTHATSDMDWAEARLGAQRVVGAYAWRTLLASGARLAAGSDFPVERVSPLEGIYAAVTRMDRRGRPVGGWMPVQRLTLDEALAAFTVAPAHAAFAERDRGTLAVGRVADLTVLDRPLVPERSLLATQVELTIVGGKIVFRRAGGAPATPAGTAPVSDRARSP